jgi:hypothetical protein
MAEDRSVVFVVTAAARDPANARVAAIVGDAPGAENITVPLSAPGAPEPTHFGAHAWQTAENATAFLALPFEEGLTDGALTVSVATGGVPSQHFGSIHAGLGLGRWFPPDEEE